MRLSTLQAVCIDVTTHREVYTLWNVIDHECDGRERESWRYLADVFPGSFSDPANVNSIRHADYQDAA